MTLSEIYDFLQKCDLFHICELLYNKKFVNEYLLDKPLKLDYNQYNDLKIFYETEYEDVMIARISNHGIYRIKTIDRQIENIDMILDTKYFIRMLYVDQILN